ncbi:GIY-YIG nuclease family protein [Paracidobacterium acidisoli]|uniref:GIY-YIG nuclease family protein n=1 Tax=Paracidobacterium acidisoli TaxID=2303751 RepID=A0A372IPS4_9BACT|nr:GIY-YIG nuclease family protein [Paracidobacterium acidisoli]MBT9331195.1 GIY-YIG nuclease family protein [Paracidobacterium acidisoli]
MKDREHNYYVYLMASRMLVLYCGVTSNIGCRVGQHKDHETPGFCATYNCDRLVWFERYQYIGNAIAREKQIKNWRREKKLALVNAANSSWVDLSEGWFD